MASNDDQQDQYSAGYDQPRDPANFSNLFTGHANGSDNFRPSDQASVFPLTEKSTSFADSKPSPATLTEARHQPPESVTPYNAGYDQPPRSSNYSSIPPAGFSTHTERAFSSADGPVPTKCITENNTNVVVSQPSSDRVNEAMPSPQSSWFVPCVFFSVFCCPLTGIFAIICLIYARIAYKNEDYVDEKARMDCTKGLTLASLVIGAASLVVYLIIFILTQLTRSP